MTSSDPPSVSDGDPPGGQFSSGQSWGGQADGGPPRAGWGIHRLRMRRGAPPRDAVLRMEHFNVTAVEQRRRAAIERSRGRLVIDELDLARHDADLDTVMRALDDAPAGSREELLTRLARTAFLIGENAAGGPPRLMPPPAQRLATPRR